MIPGGFVLAGDYEAGIAVTASQSGTILHVEFTEPLYGFCPGCGTPLHNWGAASHGDGDIYDEIGCDVCGEVVNEIHATYCRCAECTPGTEQPKGETDD